MATTTASLQTDWRQESFEIDDATYLDLASQSPMPKVSIRAVQAALEAIKNPHHKADSTFFEVPNRIRASLAKLIGGKPEEIAVTSGASAGVAAVAYALTWKPHPRSRPWELQIFLGCPPSASRGAHRYRSEEDTA